MKSTQGLVVGRRKQSHSAPLAIHEDAVAHKVPYLLQMLLQHLRYLIVGILLRRADSDEDGIAEPVGVHLVFQHQNDFHRARRAPLIQAQREVNILHVRRG